LQLARNPISISLKPGSIDDIIWALKPNVSQPSARKFVNYDAIHTVTHLWLGGCLQEADNKECDHGFIPTDLERVSLTG
jgi:hypothetical protein